MIKDLFFYLFYSEIGYENIFWHSCIAFYTVIGTRYAGGYGGNYPPVMYIQQQNASRSATESQADYWYYCRKPEGYYPHIKKCPDGWMQVIPQPPTQ